MFFLGVVFLLRGGSIDNVLELSLVWLYARRLQKVRRFSA